MKKVIFGLGILVIPMSVLAGQSDKFTFGASMGIWGYEEQGVPDFSPVSLELSATYNIHRNLDVLGNFGLGISEEKEIVGAGIELDLTIDNYIGVYLKPNIDVENYSFYALVGYSKTRLEGAVNGLTVKDTEDGTSLGFGASFGLDDSSNITVEWRQQVDSTNYELAGFVIGYNVNIK